MIQPETRICNHTGSSNIGKVCLGEKCAQYSIVNYGNYQHKDKQGGCVDYHLPRVTFYK